MLTATAGTKSKLAKPIQDLIKMIFDVESMKKAMVEFEVGFAVFAQVDQSNRKSMFPSLTEFFYIDFFLCADPQIDLQKMPLGKLSKRQIQSAYALLTEVQQVSQPVQPVLVSFFLRFFIFVVPRTLGFHRSSFLCVTGRVRRLA